MTGQVMIYFLFLLLLIVDRAAEFILLSDKMERKKMLFVKSNKNKKACIYGDYKYNYVSDNKNGTSFWRCNKRDECSASITVKRENDTDTFVREAEHVCEADPDKIMSDIIVDTAKESVCENMKSVKFNYERACLLQIEENNVPDQVQLPGYKSVKDTLARARRNFLEVETTEFAKLGSVKIPKIIGDEFLATELNLTRIPRSFCFALR